jgi:Caspase domain
VRLPIGLLTVLTFLAATHSVAAETRIALIIGNSDYANPNLKLTNPANDAAAMQRALQAAGFETIVRLNAKRLDFYRAVDEFTARIGRDQHAVGLFYYAGHGVQAEGANYLIPVDADIQAESDLEANAFDAGRVLRAMKAAQNEMNIVILDACRDNPLPKTRGIERGLARMDAPSGTFIAYAAAPGQTAQDGASGTNGVFTGELVKAMAEPGMPLEQMFKRVIAGVKADTHGGQQPWSEASIQGDFYFHPAVSLPPVPSAVDPKQVELMYWESIKDSKNVADFRAYLSKFPKGEFSGLASNRVDYLAKSAAGENSGSRLVSVKVSPPAPGATSNAVPAAASPTKKKPWGGQCTAILESAQLGESLNDEQRAYISKNCQ